MDTAAVHELPTAAQAWAAAVARHPERRFLHSDGVEYSYREFDAAARTLAWQLGGLGIGRGTHVAAVLDNSAGYLALLLALSLTGSVSVPVNSAGSAQDIHYVLDHSDARWVITDGARLPGLRAGLLGPTVGSAALDGFRLLDVSRGVRTDHRPGGEPGEPGPDDPWSIVYTSGSTGRPRGVVVPQQAFGVTGRAIVEHYGYRADDTVLCVLPLYHLSATAMGWACAVAADAAFALAPRFSRSGFWPLVDATGATVMLTVPTIVEMVLTDPPSPTDREHPLRLVITHRPYPEFAQRFGVEVACLWGMTETSGLGIGTRPGGVHHAPDVIGTPYPPDADVRLLDPFGEPVPDGTPGELFFGHPAVMLGYYREGRGADRLVRSGDLVVREADGSYRYVGRLKNMIKRGGENISGEEVERHLAEHPLVAEVVVVGVPDPIYVEEVCAVVVPTATNLDRDRDRLVEQLASWCATRLPDWKVPRYFVVRDEPIPKLANQKVDRKSLLESLPSAERIDRRSAVGGVHKR